MERLAVGLVGPSPLDRKYRGCASNTSAESELTAAAERGDRDPFVGSGVYEPGEIGAFNA
jgi:hypothetical protein